MARGFAQRQKPAWRQMRKPMPAPVKSFPGPRGKRAWEENAPTRKKGTGESAEHRIRQEEAMDELVKKFETAAGEVKQLQNRPNDSDLLKLYALYKQATVGDAAGPAPDLMDFVGEAKRAAWSQLKGTSKEQAMRNYIDMVEKLKL
jgi:diazepam-binding inhibitor (GABA receptor modulating acyl-CoA-binding protein)